MKTRRHQQVPERVEVDAVRLNLAPGTGIQLRNADSGELEIFRSGDVVRIDVDTANELVGRGSAAYALEHEPTDEEIQAVEVSKGTPARLGLAAATEGTETTKRGRGK